MNRPLPPFVHPQTHAPLKREEGGYRCVTSSDFFPDEQSIASFVPPAERGTIQKERSDFVNTIKTLLRRSPTLYRALIYTISPVFYIGLTGRKFVRGFPKEALLLNVGSGVHRYSENMINVDIYPYPEVNVIADAVALPFPKDTFDGALSECLLEHVREPEKVVREILRVLKPGGRAYITTPFIYPYHACPNDFYRWSESGMRELCKEGKVLAVSPRAGPASALVAELVTFFAIIFSFGSTPLYHALSMLFLPIFAPLKLLDLLLGKYPTAIHGAEGFFVVLQKPR